jgi:hypothetical protein
VEGRGRLTHIYLERHLLGRNGPLLGSRVDNFSFKLTKGEEGIFFKDFECFDQEKREKKRSASLAKIRGFKKIGQLAD